MVCVDTDKDRSVIIMLDKVEYTERETVITAKNLNDIQDAVIELETKVAGLILAATVE